MLFSHLIFGILVPGTGGGGGEGGGTTLAKEEQIRGRILLGHSTRTSAFQMLFTLPRLVSSSAHVFTSRKLNTTIIYGNIFYACNSLNDLRTATVSPTV
jgi:hypothetical protein